MAGRYTSKVWWKRRGFPVLLLADASQCAKMIYLAANAKRSGQENITSDGDVDVHKENKLVAKRNTTTPILTLSRFPSKLLDSRACPLGPCGKNSTKADSPYHRLRHHPRSSGSSFVRGRASGEPELRIVGRKLRMRQQLVPQPHYCPPLFFRDA